MANWRDICTLIQTTSKKNAAGLWVDGAEVKTTVPCNMSSVGYGEFYKSQIAGMQAELKITLRTIDYTGQQQAEYNGKRYYVVRTYLTKNGEYTELTLGDIGKLRK